MGTKRLRFGLLSAALAFVSSNFEAFAQFAPPTPADWPSAETGKPLKPWPTNSKYGVATYVGSWLEREFNGMVRSCLRSSDPAYGFFVETAGLFGLGTERKPVSTIPAPIVYETRLLEKRPGPLAYIVTKGQGNDARVGLGPLFSEVYSSEPKNPSALGNFSSSKASLLDFNAAAEAALPRPGFTAWEYQRSCNDAAHGEALVKGGWSVPPLSLAASQSLNTAGTHRYALLFRGGTFRSPILEMFNSNLATGGDRSRFLAATLVWDWYRRNDQRIQSTNWILGEFTGWTLFRRENFTQDFQSNGTINLNAGFFGTTAEGGASLTALQSESLKITDYGVGIAYTPISSSVNNLQWAFASLPAIADAKKLAEASADKTAYGYSRNHIWNKQEITFTQRFWGMPPALCGGGSWRASLTGAAPDRSESIKLSATGASTGVNPSSGRQDGLVYCDFHLSYLPDDAVVADRSGPYSKGVEIVHSIKAGNTTHELVLKGEDFRALRPGLPNLKFVKSEVGTTSDGKVRVNVDLLTETPSVEGVGLLNEVTHVDPRLVCEGASVAVKPSYIMRGAGQAASYFFTLTPQSRSVAGTEISCTFQSTASFQFTGISGVVHGTAQDHGFTYRSLGPVTAPPENAAPTTPPVSPG